MKKYKPYIISFIVTFAAAGIGAIATYLGMDTFDRLIKPPFTPPSFLFPIVWTILYAVMAIGAARVYLRGRKGFTLQLKFYGIHLLLNMLWSIIFFSLGAYLFAFIWLFALWLTVLLMIITFYPVDKVSSLIQIPYLIWLSFAAYLNFGIYFLN